MCEYPNGCLHDENANACPLCDELGADIIAAHYAKLEDETPLTEEQVTA
ncbi:hypothetical protein ACRQ5Q_14945 [Bradyrhizobium sp. PMVTL-01]